MGRRTRLVNKTTKAMNSQVKKAKANPLAWKVALKMVHGDYRRLRTQPDGSVIIVNK